MEKSDEQEPWVVLRAQLPLPRPYVAPRTPTEERLERIWRTALSMDRVGVEDNYLDLGADSFLATVIFAMIEEEFGHRMPWATIVGAPTIAELAREIDGVKPA